jgi:hypothetical protein
MERQITIADYLGEKELSAMSEEEMVNEVGERLGLSFQPHELGDYRAKYKGLVLTLELNTYYGSDQVIILYGFDNKKNKSGGGGPAESIDEAVERLRLIMEREAAENEKRKRELGHRRSA